MHRRTCITGLGSALLTGLAGCSALGSGDDGGSDDGSNDDATLGNGSFEDGLAGWSVGTDLPAPPGESSGIVDHGIQVTTDRAADGESTVQFYVSGVAGDGTIWVEQPLAFDDVDAVELDVYSRQTSSIEISQVAFFAGAKPEDGLVEADFDRDELIDDHEGWKTYRYDVGDVGGTGTLAVGMNVVWEADVRRLFDDVRLVGEE